MTLSLPFYSYWKWKFSQGCLSIGQMNATTINVSYPLFLDNTIIFLDTDCEKIVNLRGILTSFEAVSDLRVNLTKSCILPTGQVDNIQLFSGVLGCIALLILFQPPISVSLLVQNLGINPFRNLQLIDLRKGYPRGNQNTIPNGGE